MAGFDMDGERAGDQGDATAGLMMFGDEVEAGILSALRRRAAALQSADPQGNCWYEVEQIFMPETSREVGLALAQGPVTLEIIANILRLERHGPIIKGEGRDRTYLMKLDREDSNWGPWVRATILDEVSCTHMSERN